MILTYKFTESLDKGLTVTVFYNLRNYSYTPESHLDFYGLIGALRNYGEAYTSGLGVDKAQEEVVAYLKPEYLRKLVDLNKNLELRDDGLYYGEELLRGVLVERIMSFKKQNLPFDPYWNFLSKLMSNPDQRSREQLYEFLERNDFPAITMDGDFLSYKGLNDDFTSIHSGYGIVDGVVYEHAYLPNKVGSVVTMPRHKVNSDPKQGCSYGLHVGSLNYVNDFARGKIVIVKVNPRDVVSVPEHSSYQKVRVCQYEVVGEYTKELTELVSESYDTVTPVKDLMASLNDSDISNEYHLANRTINKLHPEASTEERKRYIEQYTPIARDILNLPTEAEPESQENPVLKPEDINLIMANKDTFFPTQNLYHTASRIMNLWLGKGNWKKSGPRYAEAEELATALYEEAVLFEDEALTLAEFQAVFLR